MAYSILSKETKQQLEQERSRLVNDREAIVASVTAEVDRLIQQLDVLLGSATTPSPIPTNSKKTTSKAPSKAPAEVVSEAPQQKTERAKPKAKRGKTKSFDAKNLKSTFKKMSPSDAVAQILSQSPDQSFETDELIASLYEPFDESEMGRARKSVSAVLLHGLRAGKFEKVQENPARYKASAGVAA